MRASDPPQSSPAGDSGLRILLVDDDPDDRELISDCLRAGMREPFHLTSATCLGEGMQQLQAGFFDVALIDLQLPDAGDTRSVRDIRQLRPDIALVALSGHYDDPSIAQQCQEAGAQDFLEKGELSPMLLSRAVGNALFQVRDLQLDELGRSFEQLQRLTSAAAGTQLASQLAGVGGMKYRLPIVYQNLALEYRNMFKAYSRYQALRNKKPLKEMQHIVEQLGLHNAGPRDLMDLHMQMAEHEVGTLGGQERFGSMGRLLVLELLGMLVNFYRDGHLDSSSHHP